MLPEGPVCMRQSSRVSILLSRVCRSRSTFLSRSSSLSVLMLNFLSQRTNNPLDRYQVRKEVKKLQLLLKTGRIKLWKIYSIFTKNPRIRFISHPSGYPYLLPRRYENAHSVKLKSRKPLTTVRSSLRGTVFFVPRSLAQQKTTSVTA